LKDDINKVGFPFSDTVVDPITVNDGLPIFSLSNIIVPRQKAEAILAVLVVSCLRLNSSCDVLHRNQDIVQPLFAAVYFFNRAKLMPFPIHLSQMKRSELTPKAMAYLHGKRVMQMLTPSEESFVRFVVLLEIIRYHSESILPILSKYESLFYEEDHQAVKKFIETYTTEEVEIILRASPSSRRKPFKGYRTKDIYLFTAIKRQVLLERKNFNTSITHDSSGLPSVDETINGTHPFTFQYPEAMATIKLEPDDSHSHTKKRKHSPSEDIASSNVAMEFDDGDMAFDYSQVKQLGV
jgi:hypothetical protein